MQELVEYLQMDCSEGFLKKHALNGSIEGVIKAKKVAELRDACDEHLQHDTTRRVLLDTTRLGRLEHLKHALPEKIARLRKVLDGGRGNSSGATEDAYDAAAKELFDAEAKLEAVTKLVQQNIVQQKLVQQKIADLQGDAPQNKRSATKASPKLPELMGAGENTANRAQKRQRLPGMCAPTLPAPPWPPGPYHEIFTTFVRRG